MVQRRKMILQRKKRREVNKGGNSPMRKSMSYTNTPIMSSLITGIRLNKLLLEEK